MVTVGARCLMKLYSFGQDEEDESEDGMNTFPACAKLTIDVLILSYLDTLFFSNLQELRDFIANQRIHVVTESCMNISSISCVPLTPSSGTFRDESILNDE